jgi:hypothetical protein
MIQKNKWYRNIQFYFFQKEARYWKITIFRNKQCRGAIAKANSSGGMEQNYASCCNKPTRGLYRTHGSESVTNPSVE